MFCLTLCDQASTLCDQASYLEKWALDLSSSRIQMGALGHMLTPFCCHSPMSRLLPRLQLAAGSMPKEPAAGAFMDTRDSRPFQDGIKDLSSLHPVTVTNC